MVRKLALAVSFALGTATVPVYALGLGELNSKSTLNQRFEGDIRLLSVIPDDMSSVKAKLADTDAFARAGVERPFYLTLLKFEPMVTPSGKTVLKVTSEFPIREPFLNFLVEVNWPKGRLLREYTVLLDPPTTTKRRPPVVQRATKAAPPAVARTTPTQPAKVSKAPASTVSPAPSSQTSADGYEYGPVKANDTAWAIAKKVRPRGVSMEQMMMALLEANPQAFINNDINRLRRGRILRVPSTAEIQALDRAQARAAYRKQQDEWLARRDARLQQSVAETAAKTEQSAEKTSDAGTAAAAGGEAATADKLRIATARPEGEGEAVAGDIEANELAATDIKTRLLTARENAETSRQEAETLRTRVDDLQARLANMQKLLSLKDEQLARLQDNVVNGEAAVPIDDDLAADAVIEADSATEADVSAVPADEVAPVSADEVAPVLADEVAPVSTDEETPASSAEVPALLTGNYRIGDIAPQIDPDRIVLGIDEPPVSQEKTSVPEIVQIDPDRIVLGLDTVEPTGEQTQPVDETVASTMEEDETAAPTAEDVVVTSDASPQTELVIDEGAGSVIEPVQDTGVVADAGAGDTVVVAETVEPAAQPDNTQPAAQDSLIPPAVMNFVEQNKLAVVGGGVAVFGLLAWMLFGGRRKGDDAAPAAAASTAVQSDEATDADPDRLDEAILNAESFEDLPDSTLLDDFSPSDINALQDETGEVDPVSEADVYIAYGRYQQAEELLRQAMERDPDRLALRHKLLEVHYATRDADAFTGLAQDMVDAGQDVADEIAWSRAQDMGHELAPDNPLFSKPETDGDSAVGTGAAVAVAAAAVGVSSAESADSADSDPLVLDDISELASAYDDDSTVLTDVDSASEVSISLDLDDASELTVPGEEATLEPISLADATPLEFEMPDAEPTGAESETVDEDSISDTLDLDSMMADVEAVVDHDSVNAAGESEFSAAELQAQLDELSDLSALDSDLSGAAPDGGDEAGAGAHLGLVTEDKGSRDVGLDEPLSLDTAFDADPVEGDMPDSIELTQTPTTDEDDVSTKLDLARAYIEMGDDDGARDILDEVVSEGDEDQRGEAEKILANIG